MVTSCIIHWTNSVWSIPHPFLLEPSILGAAVSKPEPDQKFDMTMVTQGERDELIRALSDLIIENQSSCFCCNFRESVQRYDENKQMTKGRVRNLINPFASFFRLSVFCFLIRRLCEAVNLKLVKYQSQKANLVNTNQVSHIYFLFLLFLFSYRAIYGTGKTWVNLNVRKAFI